MFHGNFFVNMDAKGRINIPSKLRETLTSRYGGTLMLTRFDKCIAAYPLEEWKIIEDKVRSQPMMDQYVLNFVRYFISHAIECDLDKAGRILIPPTLRSFANLTNTVVVSGMINWIEIWSRETWEAVEQEISDNFLDYARRIPGIGLLSGGGQAPPFLPPEGSRN